MQYAKIFTIHNCILFLLKVLFTKARVNHRKKSKISNTNNACFITSNHQTIIQNNQIRKAIKAFVFVNKNVLVK